MDSLQGASEEFKRHECLRGERTGQMAGLLAREAKSGIVVFVSEHDDETFTCVAEASQTKTNQPAPDVAALMLGQNGHRRQ